MAVTLQPLGVKCNIQCRYCYENPERAAGSPHKLYDLEKMKAAIEKEGGGPFNLFGGEPLLLPEQHLEELWSWGFEKYGSSNIQSNGTLINDAHVVMFKKYNVKVGISVDGPAELNDARWAGNLRRTRESTSKTHAAIERLCQERIPPGLIVTLHRRNATTDKLPLMCDWFRRLDGCGVTSVRLHVMGVDDELVGREYALSTVENLEALLTFLNLEAELPRLRFDLFEEMRNILLGDDDVSSCVWHACDPYTTGAVRGIDGQGQRHNCGQVIKDGVNYVKSDTAGFERYVALYHTPQDYGGCQGCRFFLMCKGECPGTALGGDWRNRSEHCGVWKGLYQRLEEEIIGAGGAPLSLSPSRQHIEAACLESWLRGRNSTIAEILRQIKRTEEH